MTSRRGRFLMLEGSVKASERSDEERRILLDFARGDREIAAGEGYDLKDVPKEADELLSAEEP